MPHNVSGRLDRFHDGVLEGWAVHPEAECQTLDVLIDGATVGTVKVGLYRADLAQAHLRGGYAKFVYSIPARYRDGRTHSIDLRHGGTSRSIDNMPTSFRLGAQARLPAVALRNRDETLDDDFSAAVRGAKHVALVRTFGHANRFMLHQRALFRSLVDAGFIAVVVHAPAVLNAPIDTTTGPYCYTIVTRKAGRDFGSWAVGASALNALLDELDEVLLLNDSIIALESDVLDGLLTRARDMGADAVGVTESYERQYHLQSYFIWLGQRICRSSWLRDAVAGFAFSADDETVVKDAESALTARLLSDGFSFACLHPYEQIAQKFLGSLDRIAGEIRDLPQLSGAELYKTRLLENLDRIVALVIDGTPVNPGHFFWDTLIESCGCRLVNRDLVILNPYQVPTHFRLGLLLAELPQARRMLLELRQRNGGRLIPAFWQGGAKTPRLLSDLPRHSPNVVPFCPRQHDATGAA